MGVTQFVEHHLYVLLTLLLSPEEDDDVVNVGKNIGRWCQPGSITLNCIRPRWVIIAVFCLLSSSMTTCKYLLWRFRELKCPIPFACITSAPVHHGVFEH